MWSATARAREEEKKRNQQGEAKSKDNQAEAGTKPGAGSRVAQSLTTALVERFAVQPAGNTVGSTLKKRIFV